VRSESKAQALHDIVIVTDRLTLRPLRAEDVTTDYLNWFSDPLILQYILAALETKTLRQLESYVREKHAAEDALLLGIFEKGNSRHIGNLKFEPIDWARGQAVLGILIGPPDWRGKGVFKEAFKASVEALEREAGIREYWLCVSDSNAAAVRAYQSAGFLMRPPPPHLFPMVRQGYVYLVWGQPSA